LTKKPSDILDFLRSTSAEPDPVVHDAGLEPTTRMLVLRRSQVVVAAAAGGLALLLTFLLGLAIGGGGDEGGEAASQTGVWTIRVRTYEATDKGLTHAKAVARQLGALELGDEVNVRRVLSEDSLTVTAGAWLEEPRRNSQAKDLLVRIRGIKAKDGRYPFREADFWPIRR